MSNPFQSFLNTPIVLLYVMDDGSYNAMTNGAWTWYAKGDKSGTIHELGNPSFTHDNLEKITHVSIIFTPPTPENVELLVFMGSNSGRDMDKLSEAGFIDELYYHNGFLVHDEYPTFCVKPIDIHNVRDYFKVMTTEFIEEINGYPKERIIDENRTFYRLVKEEIK